MAEAISNVGRDAQMALLLRSKWKDEIEKAVNRVKKSHTRSESDKWFRRQWYRALAVQRKYERWVARYRATRRWIGCGGNENGRNTMAACCGIRRD